MSSNKTSSSRASKGKEKLVEAPKAKRLSSTRTIRPKGVVVHDQPPQAMEEDTLHLPPSGGVNYPFEHAPRYSNAEQRKVYKRFLLCEVISSLTPDFDDLCDMDFVDELKELFGICGLDWMFRDDPGSFVDVMREFYSSLVVTWSDGTTNRRSREVKVAEGWKFRLVSEEFVLSGDEVRRILGVGGRGEMPRMNDNDLSTFWNSMCAERHSYRSTKDSRTETMILETLDKVFHQLIAQNIFPRPDNGRFVNKKDIGVMALVKGKTLVDVFSHLSNHFVDYQKSDHKGQGLGGGQIITWIAIHLGFILDDSNLAKGIMLTEAYMTNTQMVDKVSKKPKVK